MRFFLSCLLLIALLTVFLFGPFESFEMVNDLVNQNKFKQCKDSGFCSRLRNAQTEDSFVVEPLNIEVSKPQDSFKLELTNRKNNLNLHLWALKGIKVFRFKFIETFPLKERFQVPEVLVNDPETVPVYVKEATDEYIEVFSTNDDISVKISFKPFKLEFYADGQHIMSANSNQKLKYERTKVNQGYEERFGGHVDTVPNGPSGIRLDFTFENSDYVYGLPEQTDGFVLKDTEDGEPYRLYNLDVGEYEINSRMALYASVPYLMSHSAEQTSGLFWLNAAETWIDISYHKSLPPKVDSTWISESGIIDAFVMLGPGPKEVTKQFSTLVGTTHLPPFFALGYHQSRWNYDDQDEVAMVSANMDKYDIPNDVIWLDIEHTDDKRYFTWDKKNFKNPYLMQADLAAVGRKLVVIVDPHVKVDKKYHIYKDCQSKDLLVKDSKGKEFRGQCWPKTSAYSDFLNPEARSYYADQYKLENYNGSTLDMHIWNDMNEPSVFDGPEVTMPKDNLHYGGVEHRDMHNIYGHLYTMATHEGLLRRSNHTLRPFVLTRSAFAGTQRYSALWTGDNTARWDHLEASVPMLLSLSISGITFCGADVGGFFGNPSAELMIRWYQAGAFQPFFRSHSEKTTYRREPWLFGFAAMGFIREAIKTRYMYLPLWYTLFYEQEMKNKLPPMRPLFFEFPDTPRAYDIETQYMVGDALLVAPITKPRAVTWKVYLPPTCRWYNVETGMRVNSKRPIVELDVTLKTVPVFQRGGTIVPTLQRIRRSSAVMLHDPYTLTIALDDHGSAKGSLYIDDGKSFDYRDGHFNYIQFSFSKNTLTAVNENNNFQTTAWLERVVVLGFKKEPKSVSIGTDQLKWTFKTRILTIRKPGVKLSDKQWSIKIQT